MSKFPSQEMDRFNVRLPAGMREAIAARAKENGRSMNTEIIFMIDEALKSPIPTAVDNSKLMRTYGDLSQRRPKTPEEFSKWEEEMTNVTFYLMEQMSSYTQMYQALKNLHSQAKHDVFKNKKPT
ncbi:Arc family DNA-binding protein [Cronobacter sakazakii]|nr:MULTISPECIES: Arc family DNA-binding protein [Cronobacter]EGT4269326.1 Arc family DNA-binding protein [Cronobacter sakazakii]EGT4286415.1 Arc family DNA-binding protein [Cronobacter sakazakii]EGT4294898.1 Arc family DNA-binding protein [Cronobacter sakazakii]EGT4316065.1 Arc family DNA-binding protein [Cronobacter malonaticus]EGT4399987.1 Arc family DNA-binding protein [Cronobacter malonaticus]